MVMKPVRIFFMFLYTWRCTTFNSIPNISILLTNKNVPLIYSITFCKRKTKELCTVSFQTADFFSFFFFFLFFFMFAAFHNPSPLHNFVWNKQRRRKVCSSKKDLDQGMAVQGFMQCSHWMFISALFFFFSIILHEKQERF